MKKICFVTTIPLTIKAFVMPIADYIHNHTDWEISVICDWDSDFQDELPEYIRYFPVPMKRGVSISGIKSMLSIRKIFLDEKFDLIQYSTPNAAFYAALAGKMAKIPVRLYAQWGIAYVGFSGIKRKIFKLVEKIVCELSTWIEPDSHSNLEFAFSEKLYSTDKSSVIWNGSACGINLQKFDIKQKKCMRSQTRDELFIPESAFVFGFVGRITRDKGINELLRSFREIEQITDNVYLLLVGPNEKDLTIDPELYDWSLHCGKVIYTGYTSNVPKYLATMDVYILPSYREGFGMGVIEAEAMELPVIVTDIPGPIDAIQIGQTGVAIPPKDPVALQNVMVTILKDSNLVMRYGTQGRQFVEENFEQQQFLTHVLEDRKRLLGLL